VRRRFRDLLGRDSVNSQIAKAILVSGSSSLAVKAAALGKEAFVAAIFGVSFDLDVYLVALMLIGIPHGVVVNAVQWALLPEFVKARSLPDETAARLLLRQSVSLNLLLLITVLVGWSVLLPWLEPLFARELGNDSGRRISACFQVLIGYYFASGTLMLGYAALQANRQFKANGLIPLITPIASSLVIVASHKPSAITLAVGMVLGFIIELCTVEMLLRRNGWTLLPAGLPMWSQRSAYLGSIGKFAAGAFVISFLPLVEQAAAAQLGVGGISTLGFANKLPAVVSSLSVVAVGVAVFPYFSELLANKDYDTCRATLKTFAALLAAAGVITSTLLVLVSSPIVELFFRRGAFSDLAAVAVTAAQQAYLLQIPGALVLALAQKLILARVGGWKLLTLNLIQLGAFVVMVTVALRLSPSPTNIALSSSLATTLTAVLAYAVAMHTLRNDSRLE
jgi:putative peptidoglycan lipid II flippase